MSLSASHLLFPVPHSQIKTGFTTAHAVDVPSIHQVHLSDSALGVHKVSSGTTHTLVRPPVPPSTDSDEHTWDALFPAGSVNPGNKSAPPGGFGFYVHGPPEFARALREEAPREVLMSYAVMFEDGWEWRKGGKLPGICKRPSLAACLPLSVV
ncbi:hypothetical protein SCP_0306350 [Sparassis crispa]|uniref:Polysaccharide lyase 14 domain-containing protein n=1 Tax=Sparassis crispa TaxID=139825 RepID=A0A401GFN3_9APHY|nr:hypothetical protein SCP_0306350 [Sparassis crispa]GBE80913.1 hypothetical protein SCP_0306350 [Sparassis crispa]